MNERVKTHQNNTNKSQQLQINTQKQHYKAEQSIKTNRNTKQTTNESKTTQSKPT